MFESPTKTVEHNGAEVEKNNKIQKQTYFDVKRTTLTSLWTQSVEQHRNTELQCYVWCDVHMHVTRKTG